MIRTHDGQGLTEYALLILLVAMLLIAILILFGDSLVSVYTTILNQLTGLWFEAALQRTTIKCWIASNSAWPMPRTLIISSMRWNGPFALR